jgi:hypothetical protein
MRMEFDLDKLPSPSAYLTLLFLEGFWIIRQIHVILSPPGSGVTYKDDRIGI